MAALVVGPVATAVRGHNRTLVNHPAPTDLGQLRIRPVFVGGGTRSWPIWRPCACDPDRAPHRTALRVATAAERQPSRRNRLSARTTRAGRRPAGPPRTDAGQWRRPVGPEVRGRIAGCACRRPMRQVRTLRTCGVTGSWSRWCGSRLRGASRGSRPGESTRSRRLRCRRTPGAGWGPAAYRCRSKAGRWPHRHRRRSVKVGRASTWRSTDGQIAAALGRSCGRTCPVRPDLASIGRPRSVTARLRRTVGDRPGRQRAGRVRRGGRSGRRWRGRGQWRGEWRSVAVKWPTAASGETRRGGQAGGRLAGSARRVGR